MLNWLVNWTTRLLWLAYMRRMEYQASGVSSGEESVPPLRDIGWSWGVDPNGTYQLSVPVYAGRELPFRTVTEVAVRPFTDAMGLLIEEYTKALQVPWQCEEHEVAEACGRGGHALDLGYGPVVTAATALSHRFAPWRATATEPFTVAKWHAEERMREWAEGVENSEQ